MTRFKVDNLMWGVTLASIIGTVANILMYPWCFGIWLCTNTTWMLYNLNKRLYAQAWLFGVYVVLAVWGIYQWGMLS